MSWWDSADAFDREACMGKHRAGTGGMRDAINLIYELRALIWRADWQHCEASPTFLWECERQLTCFDCSSLSLFPELIWWRRNRTWTGFRGQIPVIQKTSKKIKFFTLFGRAFPPFSGSVMRGLNIDHNRCERNRFCCCVNRGNDLLTLGVCVHWRVYCPVLMFSV